MQQPNKIYYELPDFTASLGLNLFFARLFLQRPEVVQPGVAIESLYGSFPNCCLNGGRTYVRQQATPQQMEQTFAIMQDYGITPRLTFTNMQATPEMLNDAYANQMLAAAARHGGQVIVYASFVADYVRRKYGMPVILSTTREICRVDELNTALDEYDYVVLNYNLNKRDDVLAAVAHPEKLEVMVNEFCLPACPHRQQHYAYNSAGQHSGNLAPFPCQAHKPDFFAHQPGHATMFTEEEVRTAHDACGINHFKIVGRGVPFETQLESLVYYLVRPEFRERIRAEVLGQLRN